MSNPQSRTMWFNPICIQNIAYSYDAFQLVYVSTANYRQNVQAGRTHAIERPIKRVVPVNVGKSKRIHKLSNRLGSTFREFPLERR